MRFCPPLLSHSTVSSLWRCMPLYRFRGGHTMRRWFCRHRYNRPGHSSSSNPDRQFRTEKETGKINLGKQVQELRTKASPLFPRFPAQTVIPSVTINPRLFTIHSRTTRQRSVLSFTQYCSSLSVSSVGIEGQWCTNHLNWTLVRYKENEVLWFPRTGRSSFTHSNWTSAPELLLLFPSTFAKMMIGLWWRQFSFPSYGINDEISF